jgi:hypothetical protein
MRTLVQRKWICWLLMAAVMSVTAYTARAEPVIAHEEPSWKFKLLVTALVAGVIGGISALMNTNHTSSLAAVPTKLDFGSVPVGTSAQKSIDLVNRGDRAIEVTQFGVSDGPFSCASGGVPFTIRPGDKATVLCTFKPGVSKAFASKAQLTAHDAGAKNAKTWSCALAGSGR